MSRRKIPPIERKEVDNEELIFDSVMLDKENSIHIGKKEKVKPGDKVIIQIRDEKGAIIINFDEFLPEGTKIVAQDEERHSSYRNEFDPFSNEVRISVNSPDFLANFSKELFSLFHEIGHAHQIQDNPDFKKIIKEIKEETKKRTFLRDSIHKKDGCEFLSIRESLDELERRGDPGYEDFKKLYNEWLMLRKKRKEAEAPINLAKMERDAWARAIKIIRKVRQEKKVDLLAWYGGKWSKAMERMMSSLATYEEGYNKDGKEKLFTK